MKALLLVSILIFSAYCQVAPTWSQSSRVQTRNVELISNHISVTQTFYWNTTYIKAFTNAPWIGLSIVNLRTSTNAGSIGFMSYISNTYPNTKFEHRVDVNSPTQIWYLQVRYIAYDGSFAQLNDIKVGYKRYINTGGGADQLNTISNNPGTYRTESKSSGLTVDTTHTNVVAVFTTGFIGTINSTYFQGNVTDDIQAGGQVNVKFTVHPDTVIKQIAVYVLTADQTNLLVSCWTFVETAITKALYGVQFTFFKYKQVNYQTNYMKGLRSFSIRNNFEYNFTAYGLNFTTLNQSYYNDESHFNIWIRYCPNPYLFFNKVDFLCYILCPAGTYLISNDSLCVACDYTCATCSTGSTCDNCAVNRVKNSTGFCVCIDYYYEYNGVCMPCHYSCQQCVFPAQYVNCIKCDSNMHRTPATPSNSTCYCDGNNGWTDVGVALCSSKCSDGIINNEQCDDNNTFNDDGCSNTCVQQTYFFCDNSAPPSDCYYVGNITIQVVRIQKNPFSNVAAFFVKVTPFVPLMKDLKLQNFVTNISGATEVKLSLSGELLIYNVTYLNDLENLTLTIGLKPSNTGAFSRFYPVNTTFKANADNGLILKAYLTAQYTESITIGSVAFILGLIFFCFSVLFCYGDWKELGLQLFFALQLCFMSFLALPYLNPFSTKTCLISPVMGWNNITAQVLPPYQSSAPVLQQMGYSVAFINNFNIMVIFPGLALILYLGYRIALYMHLKKLRQGDTEFQFDDTLQGKFFNLFKFDFFVYWMLINMQQILMGTFIQAQYVDNGGIFVYIALLLIGIIVCIVGLFIRHQALQAYRKNLFHKSYGGRTFLMVLVSTLVIDLFILLSVLVKRQIFFVAFVPPIIIIVYLIVRRPFKSMWNNIRLIIIQCCVLTVFALQVVAIYLPFQIHMDDVIGIMVCMSIAVLVTLIVWIYDVVMKILKLTNQKYQEQSEKQSTKKQQESINQKVRQAGYALVHGKNGPKQPSNYEMTRFNNGPRNSNFKPQIQRSNQTPRRTNLRQLHQEKMKDDSKLRSKSNVNNLNESQVSPLNTPQNQSAIIRQRNQRKKNDTSSLPVREETLERLSPSTTRRRVNPYQQILDETSNKIR